MVTNQTNTSHDPESFLNQPTHISKSQIESMPTNINIQADDDIMTVLDGSIHKEGGDLNEMQLKVYQKFIPIKPKIESEGDYDDDDNFMFSDDMILKTLLASSNLMHRLIAINVIS